MDQTDRGKRRSRSQRIGREGEKVFEAWAIRNRLTTNRTDEDLGIDYFCQVMKLSGKDGSEESTGSLLGVQVKTVDDAASPRVSLNRIDAADLLNQAQATCIVGIHLRDTAVRFRFIDEQEIDRLLAFLSSGAETISIPFSEMELGDPKFQQMLHRITRSGMQQRLRVHLIESRMERKIRGAKLLVSQSATDSISLITLPWFGSGFQVDPDSREAVRARVFDRGETPESISGVSLKPELVAALELGEGSGVLVGRKQKRIRLTVEHETERASATFVVRHWGDEWAYVHEIGLRLGISEARETAEGWVHECHFDLFPPKRKTPIKGQILPFLRLLQPGARVLLSSGDHNWRPVTQWGTGLAEIGSAVSAAEALSKGLNLDFGDFRLADLLNKEFGHSLGFLDSFLLRSARLEGIVPTFILGGMADVPEEKILTQRVKLTIPVVMNWKETGIIAWVNCRGVAFMDGDQCCGLQIRQQEDWHLEKMIRFTKSPYPEVWIRREWPAIPLNGMKAGVYDWSDSEHSEIIVEARINWT